MEGHYFFNMKLNKAKVAQGFLTFLAFFFFDLSILSSSLKMDSTELLLVLVRPSSFDKDRVPEEAVDSTPP